jgi:hypothetical protein
VNEILVKFNDGVAVFKVLGDNDGEQRKTGLGFVRREAIIDVMAKRKKEEKRLFPSSSPTHQITLSFCNLPPSLQQLW